MSPVLKIVGAIALVLASFVATLAALDYFRPASAPVVRLIKVEDATYGGNCGRRVGVGNATQFLAKACDGHPSCTVLISVQEIGDPAQGCSKDFNARFVCDGQQPGYNKYIKGEANGSTLSLDCQFPE